MPDSTTPAAQRRRLDFRDLDELVAELQQLSAGGYRRTGQWTLSQICDHLAIFTRGSLFGFKKLLPWPIRFFVGKPLLRSLLRKRRMGPGSYTPKIFRPGEPREDTAAVDELVRLIGQFRDHSGPLRPSTLFGELSPEQWAQLHLGHASHHLSFLVPQTTTAGSTP